VTIRDPFGLKAAEFTSPSWPRRTAISFPLTASQNRIDVRRVAAVHARVADEHVVGLVRHVGPGPIDPSGEAYTASIMA
jgi:hypothetical protein